MIIPTTICQMSSNHWHLYNYMIKPIRLPHRTRTSIWWTIHEYIIEISNFWMQYGLILIYWVLAMGNGPTRWISHAFMEVLRDFKVVNFLRKSIPNLCYWEEGQWISPWCWSYCKHSMMSADSKSSVISQDMVYLFEVCFICRDKWLAHKATVTCAFAAWGHWTHQNVCLELKQG